MNPGAVDQVVVGEFKNGFFPDAGDDFPILVGAGSYDFFIFPNADTTTSHGCTDMVIVPTFSAIYVIANLFFTAGIPAVNDGVGHPLRPTIDPIVLHPMTVGDRGAIGTKGNNVVFPRKVVQPFRDVTAPGGGGCDRRGGEVGELLRASRVDCNRVKGDGKDAETCLLHINDWKT